MADIRVEDFSPAFQATDANVELLFERCVANSEMNPSAVFVAQCIDLLDFSGTLDFSEDFRIAVDVEFCSSKEPDERASFQLLNIESTSYLNGLTHFFCSSHSPLVPYLSPVFVPKLFGGWKKEYCHYLQLVNYLDKRGHKMILSGFLEFQKDLRTDQHSKGVTGTVRVLVHLPRVDYVAEYLSARY